MLMLSVPVKSSCLAFWVLTNTRRQPVLEIIILISWFTLENPRSDRFYCDFKLFRIFKPNQSSIPPKLLDSLQLLFIIIRIDRFFSCAESRVDRVGSQSATWRGVSTSVDRPIQQVGRRVVAGEDACVGCCSELDDGASDSSLTLNDQSREMTKRSAAKNIISCNYSITRLFLPVIVSDSC